MSRISGYCICLYLKTDIITTKCEAYDHCKLVNKMLVFIVSGRSQFDADTSLARETAAHIITVLK